MKPYTHAQRGKHPGIVSALVFLLLFLAVPQAALQAADAPSLFEKNQARFGASMQTIDSRSFKFLADPKSDTDAAALIVTLRDAVKEAATAAGYAFKERKKGAEWRWSEKRYLDTRHHALYQKGYVIREIYRYAKGSAPDPDTFTLTLKELSPDDFTRLSTSAFGPAHGSDIPIAYEENISLNADGTLHSYFESSIAITATNAGLGGRTLGDYATFYPALLTIGLPATATLIPVSAQSVQLKAGSFILPGGSHAEMSIEVWTSPTDAQPIAAEISFDSKGYDSASHHLKAMETFFLQVIGNGMKRYAMPDNGSYMGSKLRVLFDQKHP